jgi:hypothetical protein
VYARERHLEIGGVRGMSSCDIIRGVPCEDLFEHNEGPPNVGHPMPFLACAMLEFTLGCVGFRI